MTTDTIDYDVVFQTENTVPVYQTFSNTLLAEERVEKGLRFLQEQGAALGLHWENITADLRVSDPQSCPLAMASGATYGRGVRIIGDHLRLRSEFERADWMREHGFLAHHTQNVGYKELTAAWRNALANEHALAQ